MTRQDYYMFVSWHLSIDKATLRFSPTAFRGCLVHELAHIVQHREHYPNTTHSKGTTDYYVVAMNWEKNCCSFIRNTTKNTSLTKPLKA